MIKVNDLSFSRSGTQIISHCSFKARPEEKVLIHGRSGTGKSSFFKLLLGFEQPDTGAIEVNGMRLAKESIRDIRQAIYYLSQDVDLPDLKGAVLMETSLKLNKTAPPSTERLAQYLEILSFSQGLLDQPVSHLSGGERQRLGLLLCFLLDRPLWLLDEPTAALDKASKAAVIQFIAETDKTVLVISHDDLWQGSAGFTLKEW